MQTALSATAVSDLSTRTSSDSQETSKPAADTRARPSGASPNVRLRVNRKSSSAKKAEKKAESDNEVVPAIAGNHFAILAGFVEVTLSKNCGPTAIESNAMPVHRDTLGTVGLWHVEGTF